jgi:hypothetical protein
MAKARVEGLSHRRWSSREDILRQKGKEGAMGLGRMTGNLMN